MSDPISSPCVSVNLILGRIIAALRDEAGDSQVKFAARFKKKPVNLGPDVLARLEVGRSSVTAPQLYWIERHFVDRRVLPQMGSIFTLANACERKLKRRGMRVVEKAPKPQPKQIFVYSLVQELVHTRNTHFLGHGVMGNTTGSDSVVQGSSPCAPTRPSAGPPVARAPRQAPGRPSPTQPPPAHPAGLQPQRAPQAEPSEPAITGTSQ